MSILPEGPTYLQLTSLEAPHPLGLRIVVTEALPGGPEKLVAGIIPAREIGVSADSRQFALQWDEYIAYSIRAESYAVFNKERPDVDDVLIERVSSAYLRFVSGATLADKYFDTPVRHWELRCLDHLIDVAAIHPPTISEIGRATASGA